MSNNRLINPDDSIAPIAKFEMTLPDFAVITGINGSGKTRLLSSIKNGQIKYQYSQDEFIPPNKIEVIRDPGSLIPFQGQEVSDYNLMTLVGSLANTRPIITQIQNYRTALINEGKVKKLIDYSNKPSSEHGIVESTYANDLIYSELQSYYNNPKSELSTLDKNVNLKRIVQQTNGVLNILRQNDFEIQNKDVPYLLIGSQLHNQKIIPKISLAVPQAFALLQTFENWRVAYARNEYQKYRVSKNKKGAKALTQDEFIKIYGPRPWEVLNKLLKSIGSKLQFHIDEELLDEESTPFRELNLEDEKGTVFPANGVSKGERIVFLIVLRRYAKTTDGIRYNNPKLLLLDELDAHLHPSLSGELLGLLKKSFVDEGVKIIFVTHSPSTVAQCEEGALVVLRPYEQPKISTRREALNILMSGQEKMFIDLSQAKIIFVEDSSDVEIFESLTATFIEDKTAKRLVFKSLSKKNSKGTLDGGKSRVKAIMDILGIEKNVIGLIDYDGKEVEKDGIFVLCGKERYGIENLLLDPRILIYIVLRNDTQNWIKKFNLDILTVNDFSSLDDTDVQNCINLIENIVLDKPSAEKKLIKYMDGKTFEIAKEFLTMNCHTLDELIEKKLRLSKKLSTKKYIAKIAREIIPEIKGSVPKSLKTTLNNLYK